MSVMPGRVSTSAPTLKHNENHPLSLDTAGNARTSLGTSLAGERLQDSATNSYLATRQVCRGVTISTTSAVTIGGGVANDTHLMGVVITKALTGTCVITGFVDNTGVAKSITFPAATAAASFDYKGMINEAGAVTVTCSNASDDDLVTILWMPAV